jgi:hypothetical protein
MRHLVIASSCLVLLALSGCGGNGSTAVTPPANINPPVVPPVEPPAATIEGVATPSSVAVVTATNAQ